MFIEQVSFNVRFSCVAPLTSWEASGRPCHGGTSFLLISNPDLGEKRSAASRRTCSFLFLPDPNPFKNQVTPTMKAQLGKN